MIHPNRHGLFAVAVRASGSLVEFSDARRWSSDLPGFAESRVPSRLIATNKPGQSVSVFDIATGRELARVPTTRAVVHGVAVSDDDRYAYVSIEGKGRSLATVDVIDLETLKKVARASMSLSRLAGWTSGEVKPWRDKWSEQRGFCAQQSTESVDRTRGRRLRSGN